MENSSNPQQNVGSGNNLISVVVPIFNEGAVLDAFYHRLKEVLDTLTVSSEIIFVDDGSTDNSHDFLLGLRQYDERIAIVSLSRNFGKEIAMTAGLDHARGDAVILIDADLQDPPELIPELIGEWQEGCDMVYAKRLSREGESWIKKFTAHGFYRLMGRAANIEIPEDTGDFRLLSRKTVNALRQIRERHRFMKGLFAWVGYRQKFVTYRRQPRHAGNSKWNYWRLWNFALEGITSFTTAPLRVATYLGLMTALGSFVFGAYIIYDALVWANPVKGYPSLMVVILFLGGIQLVAIGIIGEYLGRVFEETKQRPLYLVDNYLPAKTANTKDSNHTTMKAQTWPQPLCTNPNIPINPDPNS